MLHFATSDPGLIMHLPHTIRSSLHEALNTVNAHKVFDAPSQLISKISYLPLNDDYTVVGANFDTGVLITGTDPDNIKHGFIIGEPNTEWWKTQFIDSPRLYEREDHYLVMFLGQKFSMSTPFVATMRRGFVEGQFEFRLFPIINGYENSKDRAIAIDSLELLHAAIVIKTHNITIWV